MTTESRFEQAHKYITEVPAFVGAMMHSASVVFAAIVAGFALGSTPALAGIVLVIGAYCAMQYLQTRPQGVLTEAAVVAAYAGMYVVGFLWAGPLGQQQYTSWLLLLVPLAAVLAAEGLADRREVTASAS